MGDGPTGVALELDLLHIVRCLGCGAFYAKPKRGGTISANPGCPECGYVGWLTTSSASAIAQRHRFDEDRLRRRSASRG
jgi:predicted  nucleic acid-binding Zn-ribbon protein